MVNVYKWALTAEPGELKVYHTGERLGNGTEDEKEAFAAAWTAHEHGLVMLTQRRLRGGQQKGELQYLAIRVSTYVGRLLGIIEHAQGSLSYRRAY